jgi:hypothetical protein
VPVGYGKLGGVPNRPLPPGDTFFTPNAGPTRRAVERKLAIPLLWLHGQSRLLVGVLPLVLVIAVAVITGPLVLIPGIPLIAFVGAIHYLAWPAISPGARTIRMLVLLLIVALVATEVGR